MGLDRVIQQAIVHAAVSSAKHVDTGSLLVFMLQEEESHAAYFLRGQGVDRLTLLRVISHGGEDDARLRAGRRRGARSLHRLPIRSKPTRPTSWLARRRARSIRSSAVDSSSSEWSRCCAAAGRTIRCSWANRASARRRWPKGLALRIHQGDVPDVLKDAKVYALDLGALLAGTRYRGDFEERVKQVLDRLSHESNAILFIDEIHSLVGAGAASGGAMDAGNLLKPALADGIAPVHRLDDVQRRQAVVRSRSRAVAAVPEDRRARTVRERDARDSQGTPPALRVAPRREIHRRGAGERGEPCRRST